jgi:hypothetical protein
MCGLISCSELFLRNFIILNLCRDCVLCSVRIRETKEKCMRNGDVRNITQTLNKIF